LDLGFLGFIHNEVRMIVTDVAVESLVPYRARRAASPTACVG
jgi:hypothetical protein